VQSSLPRTPSQPLVRQVDVIAGYLASSATLASRPLPRLPRDEWRLFWWGGRPAKTAPRRSTARYDRFVNVHHRRQPDLGLNVQRPTSWLPSPFTIPARNTPTSTPWTSNGEFKQEFYRRRRPGRRQAQSPSPKLALCPGLQVLDPLPLDLLHGLEVNSSVLPARSTRPTHLPRPRMLNPTTHACRSHGRLPTPQFRPDPSPNPSLQTNSGSRCPYSPPLCCPWPPFSADRKTIPPHLRCNRPDRIGKRAWQPPSTPLTWAPDQTWSCARPSFSKPPRPFAHHRRSQLASYPVPRRRPPPARTAS